MKTHSLDSKHKHGVNSQESYSKFTALLASVQKLPILHPKPSIHLSFDKNKKARIRKHSFWRGEKTHPMPTESPFICTLISVGDKPEQCQPPRNNSKPLAYFSPPPSVCSQTQKPRRGSSAHLPAGTQTPLLLL